MAFTDETDAERPSQIKTCLPETLNITSLFDKMQQKQKIPTIDTYKPTPKPAITQFNNKTDYETALNNWFDGESP